MMLIKVAKWELDPQIKEVAFDIEKDGEIVTVAGTGDVLRANLHKTRKAFAEGYRKGFEPGYKLAQKIYKKQNDPLPANMVIGAHYFITGPVVGTMVGLGAVLKNQVADSAYLAAKAAFCRVRID